MMLFYVWKSWKLILLSKGLSGIFDSKRYSHQFDSSWKPEYGRYMIEGTPGVPYGGKFSELLQVQVNMRKRRELVQSMLDENEFAITMTNFPHLGSGSFLTPTEAKPTPLSGASCSLFIPDEAINPHARFSTLTANIRERKGTKVAINVPIFKDSNTMSPFKEACPPSLKGLTKEDLEIVWKSTNTNRRPQNEEILTDKMFLQDIVPDSIPDHIYMDCMCFGMGCSCLQITFQACSVEEARKLYDHLAVLSPIMVSGLQQTHISLHCLQLRPYFEAI